MIDELYPQIRSVFYQTDTKIAKMYAAKIIDEYAGKYPSAIKCLQEDFEACIQHMAFPAGHQKHIRESLWGTKEENEGHSPVLR